MCNCILPTVKHDTWTDQICYQRQSFWSWRITVLKVFNSSVILQLFLKTNSQHNLSPTTFLVWVWGGGVLVGTFIQGWVLIYFFCLPDGHLFEVGANSKLGAYSNKYGIWKYPPPPCHCPHSAIQWVMGSLVIIPKFSSVIQTHLFSAIGAAVQDKKDWKWAEDP